MKSLQESLEELTNAQKEYESLREKDDKLVVEWLKAKSINEKIKVEEERDELPLNNARDKCLSLFCKYTKQYQKEN